MQTEKCPITTGLMDLGGRNPESGSISHYINPSSLVRSHSCSTAKMTATHQEELFDKLRVLWFFIELNMLLFFMISRHRRQQNPSHAQPAPPPQPPAHRRRKPQNPWVMPWILQPLQPVGLKLAVTLRVSTGKTYT